MAFRWRADDGPLLVVFGSSLLSTKKKRCQSWTPSDKSFWIRAWSLTTIRHHLLAAIYCVNSCRGNPRGQRKQKHKHIYFRGTRNQSPNSRGTDTIGEQGTVNSLGWGWGTNNFISGKLENEYYLWRLIYECNFKLWIISTLMRISWPRYVYRFRSNNCTMLITCL